MLRRSPLAASLATSLLVAAAATLAAEADYWLAVRPADEGERALRAVIDAGAADPRVAAESLRALSAAHPGTAASGLAQLAAGLRLQEAGAPPDQVAAALSHPDLALTRLAEHALLGQARALSEADRHGAAAVAYLSALDRRPDAPGACQTLRAAARSFGESGETGRATTSWRRHVAECRSGRAEALLALAGLERQAGRDAEAALVYDRLDREHPASREARSAAADLQALAGHLPPGTPEERLRRRRHKALAFFDAGLNGEAATLLRGLVDEPAMASARDELLVRLGRAEQRRRRFSEARAALEAVPASSPRAAEAAYRLAEIAAERGPAIPAFEAVADRFAGGRWAQEALFALGNHFQRDALDERALPHYRRLYREYPDGPFLERVTWRVGWGDYRAGRYAEAAAAFEATVRKRPDSSTAGIFLYWAGRSRLALGQTGEALRLLSDTVRGFKHTYHGQRAQAELERLATSPLPLRSDPLPPPAIRIPEPTLTRVRQLLLIDRFAEAADELRALPASRGVSATLAWTEARAGRFPPAIRAMARAYPAYPSSAGDRLPGEVWRLLFPLGYPEALEAAARAERLDPALVAALVHQESHFAPDAVSGAGALGLMQVMPATGQRLARQLRVRYSRGILFEPDWNLKLGARYLRQMMDRFDDKVERALAAYNAGPHRVTAWEALHPGLSEEEFVESIPFTQTRLYVRKVLSIRHQYRRLYAFGAPESKRADGAGGHP